MLIAASPVPCSAAFCQIPPQALARFHLVMGGLRAGMMEPWDASLRASIRHHWQHVAATTGQPFDFARTRAFGEQGFRAVLCAENGQYGFLTLSYRSFEDWLHRGRTYLAPTTILAIVPALE